MNLKLISIELECKSGNVEYKFNKHINAFYGNIGVGKTSLMNLISFCLGNDLVHTLAIDEEVLSCKLSVLYNDSAMSLKRRISSNFIVIKYNGSEIQAKAKDAYRDDISDFFYKQEGIKQQYWLPKKNATSQKKVKISFANFYWFSYLNQDEIDNSLFYLKDSQNYYKQIASRSVLFGCLGGDSYAESEFQDQLRNLSSTLEETKQKISYGNELRAVTPLFSVNISMEILKKKQEIQTLKTKLDDTLSQGSSLFEKEELDSLLQLQYTIGLYEAEVKYLSIFGRIKSLIEAQATAKQNVENKIVATEYEKSYSSTRSKSFSENIEKLKGLLLDTLKRIKFPGMEEGDSIRLSATDYFPILHTFSGKKKADYYTLSSGGKKTIYKICYAIAIHRLIAMQKLKTLIPKYTDT